METGGHLQMTTAHQFKEKERERDVSCVVEPKEACREDFLARKIFGRIAKIPTGKNSITQSLTLN
tara:strand:- start:801 stop:995 length:195 start_codon:yes stop_codon:yes gene_type:complete